jgi:hypothetical protein
MSRSGRTSEGMLIPPLRPRARRAALTAHIVVSVGLLGDSAGFLAIAVRAAATANTDLARSSYELLKMFSLVFGIPLSFAALATGLVLGLGTKWGVFRYPWVTAKLLLIVSVIVVGAFVLGPAVDEMRAAGGNAEARLIAGAAYDVLALTLATSLGVYKPGRRRQRSWRGRTGRSDFYNRVTKTQREGGDRAPASAAHGTGAYKPRPSRSATEEVR